MKYELSNFACTIYTISNPPGISSLSRGGLFNPYLKTTVSSDYFISASSKSITSLSTTNTIDNNFCSTKQKLTAATITSKTYYSGDTAIIINFSEFTIVSTCSDLVWTYTSSKYVYDRPYGDACSSTSTVPISLDAASRTYTIYTTDLSSKAC